MLNSKITYIFLIILLITLNGCSDSHFKNIIQKTPQNTLFYLNKKTENNPLISTKIQSFLWQDFVARYYSPWTYQHILLSNKNIKDIEIQAITKYLNVESWGGNLLPNSKTWIEAIAKNMAMNTFPNHYLKAITIATANLRLLPTNEPLFNNPQTAGEGYPFDYLQESSVLPNRPALILQTSLDGAWSLVLMSHDIGWLPTRDLAFVNEQFIRNWQTGHYIAITKDNLPIFSSNQFLFKTSLGAIYPLVKSSAASYKILVATVNDNEEAIIKTALIPKSSAILMPLELTSKNIALLANNLIGKPYGWGGINNLRDCSLTIMDLFTPFGIWLPRNSFDQIHSRNFLNLKDLTDVKKENLLKKVGIPFLTLVGLPGHIMLYIGNYDGKLYVLQNVWGIHTRTFYGKKSRFIIGRTVITPIDIDQHRINVPKSILFRINSLANVTAYASK